MERNRWAIVAISAALGVGVALGAGACGEDRGNVDVEGSSTGGGTNTAGTNTAGGTTAATVDRSATDATQLAAAMSKVKSYAEAQAGELVTATEKLQKAVDEGDVAAAKKAYAAGRPNYERIEPLVVLFPELDGKIDAREDDFPKKAADPDWTGFHPIERDLWKEEKITASTKKLAAGLVTDSERLNTLMKRARVTPEVVIPGTAELIDEVEESKITGEEERYSKLDLPTFVANLDGAEAFYDTLAPLVKAKDPRMDKQIEAAFDEANAEVEDLKKSGEFVSYDELTDAQKRAVKQNIEALAEPLARVQGVLGVKK